MDFLAIELEIEAGVMVLAYLDAHVVQCRRVFDFSDGLTIRRIKGYCRVDLVVDILEELPGLLEDNSVVVEDNSVVVEDNSVVVEDNSSIWSAILQCI